MRRRLQRARAVVAMAAAVAGWTANQAAPAAPPGLLPDALAPEEAAATAARLERLYGPVAAPRPVGEERLEYAVRARWLFIALPAGCMRSAWRRETLCGREVYRLRQRIELHGHYLEEESVLDAEGLFPLAYTRRSHYPREDERTETALWDHLGRRLYLSKHRWSPAGLGEELSRVEWVLGRDVPEDALDPLAAVFVYRCLCVAASNAVPWEAFVIAGHGETYTLTCRPAAPPPGAARARRTAEAARQVRVDWVWDAREPDVEDRTVRTVLALDAEAAPVFYAATAWSARGVSTLTVRTRRPAKAP